jgi:hypothetical protein
MQGWHPLGEESPACMLPAIIFWVIGITGSCKTADAFWEEF